jgi:hypothetical protein
MPVVCALEAADWAFMGFSHRHLLPLYLCAAAFWVASMFLWAFVMPRSIVRQGERIKTLRHQVEARYGGLSAQG